MKSNHSIIAAAVVAFFAAGACATYPSQKPAIAAAVTAMQADEGVPHNLVTAMTSDEGVPRNLITAMQADEGVPHDLVTKA